MRPPEPCPLGPATFLLGLNACLLNSTSHPVLGAKFWVSEDEKGDLEGPATAFGF